MKAVVIALLVIAVVLGASCGPTEKGVAPAATGCAPSVASFGEPCATCMQSQCNDVTSSCYGVGWRQAQYGGTCSALFDCLCSCDAGDCTNVCLANASSDCQACLGQVSGCESSSCFNECSGPQDAGSG